MHKISEKMAEKVEHAFANLLTVHKILETFLSLFQKICPPKFVWIFGQRSFQQIKPKYPKNFGEKFSGTDSKMCSRIL